MDIEILRAELNAGSYNADPQLAADQLNAPSVTRIKPSMTGAEIWAHVDLDEFAALTSGLKSQMLALGTYESVDSSDGGWGQRVVMSIFGNNAATITALKAARNETISRAEQLGLGKVTMSHVLEARNQLND